MSSNLMDIDAILSENEEWMRLEEDWKSVDLETEDDSAPPMTPAFSTLEMRKTTFDSSFLFKKVRRKVGRRLSKKSAILDYNDFIHDLQHASRPQPRQFYFIGGQIMSAISIEEICDKIDDIFKSIEKLNSATSTIRNKKGKQFPEVVQCSISSEDLSFDDTVSEKEKSDGDNIDRFIDEAFGHLSYTMATLSANGDGGKESVTTLVKRFSSILSNAAVNCSPRRQRQCCNRFKELANFWNHRAFDEDK